MQRPRHQNRSITPVPSYARPARHSSERPSPRRRSSSPARRDVPAPRNDRAERISALARELDVAAQQPAGPQRDFAQLGLPPKLVTVLARRGITDPTPIQVRTLPDALAGRDILGRAQTGSGKTLAFGLPLLARLASDGPAKRPRALVLVPTRELAEQVKEALAPVAHAVQLRVTAVYGGASMGRQVDALARGIDVLVATPGRLEDHLRQGTVTLDHVEVTVLDEADYMTDLGFLPAVKRLLDLVPAGTQRLLFSATLDGDVEGLVRDYLSDPALHAVAAAGAPVETMDHRAFTVPANEEKVTVSAEIASRPARTLFFVRTKHGADRLAKQIERAGTQAAAIHGNLRQSQRQRALDAFAAGHTRVLVATDVAARGIHVDDVDLVVHYDPPADHKDYLHRSGRTARAGSEGTVLSLLLPDQVREAGRLFQRAGVTVAPQPAGPGSEPVREVATSGEAVVMRAMQRAEQQPGEAPGRPRRARPAYG
ncbi:MAG: DEAD/DEAH box helicase, partial [Actinomycetota bacterium]|nr:DEAD/DEAH box helicase [Actinomycetota bacterium]